MIGAVAERGDFVRCPGLELFPLPLVPGAAAAGGELPNWLPYMTTGLLNSIDAANKIPALNVKVWLDSPPLRLAAALLDHWARLTPLGIIIFMELVLAPGGLHCRWGIRRALQVMPTRPGTLVCTPCLLVAYVFILRASQRIYFLKLSDFQEITRVHNF